jgi:hypothetical protein
VINTEFIQTDTNGDFIIIKVGSKITLESMKNGNFWFRHPAFFNHQQNCNNDHSRGDANDNKLASIVNTDIVDMPSKTYVGCIETRKYLN